MLETLIAAFETVEDPRCAWKVEHRLLDILVIAVCAVLGEAESFEDIALYGRRKREWLEGFLALPNGIPSHDTFRRVLMGTVKLSSKGMEKRRSSLELRTYAAALAPVISTHIANACARTARYSAAGR